MKKYLIISSLGLLAFASIASAQSYAFGTDLYLGSQGSDVAALQTFLIGNGYNIPSVTSGAQPKGYFGTQTQAALSAFQLSVGITSNGFFGPITRTWINTHGSVNNGNGGGVIVSPAQPIQPQQPTYPSYPTYPTYPSNSTSAPIITKTDAPSSLVVNQPATWTVHVFSNNSSNSALSYTVNWGDGTTGGNCTNGYQCQTSLPVPVSASPQTSFSATHSYSTSGTYSVDFTVQNSGGYSAQSNSVVQVTNNGISNSAGPLQITSPNGGEVWQKGSIQSIRWTAPFYFAAAYVDLKITQTYNCTTQICPAIAYAPYTIATNIPINQNSYSWNVGSVTNFNAAISTLPDGQYTLQICQSGTSNCDSSNATFTVTSSSSINPISQLTVTSPNGGEVWAANSIHPITWNTLNLAYSSYYNTTAVDIYLTPAQIYNCPMIAYPSTVSNCGNSTTYTLDRNISSNTSYNWVVGTDINNNTIPAGNYIVEVCPAGSMTNCDTSNSYFTISGTAYPSSSGYYTAPVYGASSYNNSTGYSSTSQCPVGYVCTPATNSGYSY